MSTMQVKLSGTPSLFDPKPRAAKEGGASFEDSLKSLKKADKGKEGEERLNFSSKNTMPPKKDKELSEGKKEEVSLERKEGEMVDTSPVEKGGAFTLEKKEASLLPEEEEKVKEAMYALLSSFFSDLSLKIGVKEEEVLQFLNENGVSFDELLDIDTWKEFTVNFHNLSEKTEILMNDGAFQDLKKISELLDALVDSSEMRQMAAGLTEGGMEVKEVFQRMFSLIMKEKISVNVEGAIEERLPSKEEVFLSPLAEEVEPPVENIESVEGKEAIKEVSLFETSSRKEEGERVTTKSERATEQSLSPIGSRLFDRLADSVKNLEGSHRLPSEFTASDILNQVKEELKFLKAPDQTSLELMLQPASLGKVMISVTSRNGVMQAELRVENPEARQALMNNIADLKTSFENQGFKVAEIEIMLAEAGIDQRDEGRQPEEEKKNKGKTKKIDFLTEERAEEADLEVPVRVDSASGSNVDYSA